MSECELFQSLLIGSLCMESEELILIEERERGKERRLVFTYMQRCNLFVVFKWALNRRSQHSVGGREREESETSVKANEMM